MNQMNRTILVLAGWFLLAAMPTFAQEWVEYQNLDDLFQINFPGQPTVKEIEFPTELGNTAPARVYTAKEDRTVYSLTVVDFKDAEGQDWRGSQIWAAWQLRKRGGEVTLETFAQTDRIAGIQLQITNADKTRSYIGIHPHERRLYIMEATAPPDAPPPSDFPQTLSVLDEQGRAIRYDVDDEGNRVKRIFADEQYQEEYKYLEGANEILPPC